MSTPVPVVDVNLRRCPEYHAPGEACPDGGDPVLLPCPIPRSFRVTVSLGECDCGGVEDMGMRSIGHELMCPARPIRVACNISGKTWAASRIAEFERADVEDRAFSSEEEASWCAKQGKDRWALVKALVLGAPMAGEDTKEHLFAQRNAVFAALAKVAALERALFDAQGEYTSAMDEHHHPDWHRDPESYEIPSQKMLTLYVERLIEQVGNL